MKRYLTILAAAAAIVCGCNKYDDTIADLQDRVDKTEKTVNDLVSKVDALQKLVDAATSGISITSVTAVDGGFTVAFSDGTSFTVINGKDGQAGAAGQDAEGITVTEDSLCYNFDFGDGSDIISVAKAGAFAFKIESDVIELAAGVPASIPYVLVGADESTKIFVESADYDVEVGDTEISVSAAKVVPGCFILKAIRNSDGATCAFVITVEKKEIENVTISLTVDGISDTGAIIHATISNQEVYYMLGVTKTSYFDYTSCEEAFQEDYDYYFDEYGLDYADYGFSSFEELFTEGLCYKGDVDDDWTGYLSADTDYTAYAYAIDEDLNVVSAELVSIEFTTDPTPAIDGEYLGVGIWHDVFVSYFFNFEGENLDLPVDVYETAPGVYLFDSPYNYANQAAWYDTTPEDMQQYTGNWRPAKITIDASNPDEVHFPVQDLGVCCNSTYGWISGGAEDGSTVLSTGTLKDGVISFTGEMCGALSKYNSGALFNGLNEEANFTIILPDSAAGAPAKAKAAESKINVRKSLKAAPKAEFTLCK